MPNFSYITTDTAETIASKIAARRRPTDEQLLEALFKCADGPRTDNTGPDNTGRDELSTHSLVFS